MTENSKNAQQGRQDSGEPDTPSKSVWSEPTMTRLEVAMTEGGVTILGDADTMS